MVEVSLCECYKECFRGFVSLIYYLKYYYKREFETTYSIVCDHHQVIITTSCHIDTFSKIDPFRLTHFFSSFSMLRNKFLKNFNLLFKYILVSVVYLYIITTTCHISVSGVYLCLISTTCPISVSGVYLCIISTTCHISVSGVYLCIITTTYHISVSGV